MFEMTTRQMPPAPRHDDLLTDWFVEEPMETTELKDSMCMQDSEVPKWVVIDARGYACHFRIREPEAQVDS